MYLGATGCMLRCSGAAQLTTSARACRHTVLLLGTQTANSRSVGDKVERGVLKSVDSLRFGVIAD